MVIEGFAEAASHAGAHPRAVQHADAQRAVPARVRFGWGASPHLDRRRPQDPEQSPHLVETVRCNPLDVLEVQLELPSHA